MDSAPNLRLGVFRRQGEHQWSQLSQPPINRVTLMRAWYHSHINVARVGNLGGNAVCWFNLLLFLDMVRDVYIRFLPLIREFKQRRFRVKSQGEVDF